MTCCRGPSSSRVVLQRSTAQPYARGAIGASQLRRGRSACAQQRRLGALNRNLVQLLAGAADAVGTSVVDGMLPLLSMLSWFASRKSHRKASRSTVSEALGEPTWMMSVCTCCSTSSCRSGLLTRCSATSCKSSGSALAASSPRESWCLASGGVGRGSSSALGSSEAKVIAAPKMSTSSRFGSCFRPPTLSALFEAPLAPTGSGSTCIGKSVSSEADCSRRGLLF
mmetsp:Transcript_53548/g.123077  ORF Transcript_53548/g.123077 Transcript_53548/m.123077 type:complete len:225 (-) Transcript_53548:818-1492(-)